jgi:hypothetical protein
MVDGSLRQCYGNGLLDRLLTGPLLFCHRSQRIEILSTGKQTEAWGGRPWQRGADTGLSVESGVFGAAELRHRVVGRGSPPGRRAPRTVWVVPAAGAQRWLAAGSACRYGSSWVALRHAHTQPAARCPPARGLTPRRRDHASRKGWSHGGCLDPSPVGATRARRWRSKPMAHSTLRAPQVRRSGAASVNLGRAAVRRSLLVSSSFTRFRAIGRSLVVLRPIING